MGIFNFICFTGLWAQPIAFALILKILNINVNSLSSDILVSFLFSFVPSLYIFNENTKAKNNGKQKFGLFDFLNFQDPVYHNGYKQRSKYPIVQPNLISNKSEGIIFGESRGKFVRKGLNEDGHVFVIGGSGSGKSSCVVIPTLLDNPKTGIMAIDIKGELSLKTAKYGDENTIIFNPTDRSTFGYNPFYALSEESTNQEILECMHLTACSLIHLSADTPDPFWKQSARNLLTGLLIYYYKKGYLYFPDICSEILKKPMKDIVEEATNSIEDDSIEASYLNQFKGIAEETLSGFSTEITLHITIFAVDQNLKYAMKENPLKMNPKMLNENKHIYLSIKEEKLRIYHDLFQLIINQTLAEMELRPEDSQPVLIVIDELPRILSEGKLDKLVDSLRTLRSRKVTLFLVTQSLDALIAVYREAETEDIVSNCPYIIVLSAKSEKTQKKVISWCGKYKEKQISFSGSGKNRKTNINYIEKDIVEPTDLVELPRTDEAILISDFGYNRIKKMPYYKVKKWKKKTEEIINHNKEIIKLEL